MSAASADRTARSTPPQGGVFHAQSEVLNADDIRRAVAACALVLLFRF